MDVDNEMLSELVTAAMLKSPCAEAACRVSVEPRKFWVDFVHLDPHPHTCTVCHWGAGYPRRFLSLQALVETPRESQVRALANWLSHLHAHPTPDELDSGGSGGGGTPIDADAPSNAAGGDGVASADGALYAWDGVGSSSSN